MQKYQDRILFLKSFTAELIHNSKTEEVEETVEIKPKEKENEIFIPHIEPEEEKPKRTIEINVPVKKKIIAKPLPANPPPRRTLLRPMTITRPLVRPMTIPESKFAPGYNTSVISQPKSLIKPIAAKTPETFDLGKLNFLISDPRITLIECPGPGKFILVRASGQTTVTKVSLSSEEIQGIVDGFSQASRIPVISGLFKAAVGDLIITAVMSEVVGSRFIITKITPYSMLEGNI